MARKGKKKQNKNKKVKRNYNKKEFCEVFCQTCLICQKPDPILCYTSLYKHEPKPFINKVFNNLTEIHAIYQAMGKPMKTMSVEQFRNVVCGTGMCFNGDSLICMTCDMTKKCYLDFMGQMGGGDVIHHAKTSDLIEFKNSKSNKRYTSYNRKKKRGKKNRRVYASYPTFFSRDNADFQAEIRKILYGDNDNQQDKDKELSATDSRAADRDTKGGEPKVHRGSSEGSVDGES